MLTLQPPVGYSWIQTLSKLSIHPPIIRSYLRRVGEAMSGNFPPICLLPWGGIDSPDPPMTSLHSTHTPFSPQTLFSNPSPLSSPPPRPPFSPSVWLADLDPVPLLVLLIPLVLLEPRMSITIPLVRRLVIPLLLIRLLWFRPGRGRLRYCRSDRLLLTEK